MVWVWRQGAWILCGILLGCVAAPSTAGAGTARSQSEPSTAVLGVRDWFGRLPEERQTKSWQLDKNPTLAMVCSFVLPGLGQLYNEREFWSLVAAGIHFYFIGDIIVQQRYTNHYRERKNDYRELKDLPYDENDPEQVAAHEEALTLFRESETLFLFYRDNRIQSTWLLGLTVLLSGLQSFTDAHLFDFDADKSLQLEPALGSVQGGALRLRF